MEPKISVIVPAYKVGAYLRACLQSIRDQSMEAFEVIVIDDDSPDDCGAIADAFAGEDERFLVIHKQNEGVSRARNDGINRARGEFVWFVDGDDMVAPGAFQALADAAAPDMDMLLFQHEMFPVKRTKPYSRALTLFSEQDIAELRRQNVYANKHSRFARINVQSASYSLYRTAFLRENALYFRSDLIKEQDVYFNFEALTLCRSAAHLDAPLHLYRRHAGSISVRYNPDIKEMMLGVWRAYADAISRYYGKDPEIAKRLLLRHLVMARPPLFLYYCNAENPHSWQDRRAEFRSFLGMTEIRQAYAHVNELTVSFPNRVIYKLIGWRAFFPLDCMYRLYTKHKQRRMNA